MGYRWRRQTDLAPLRLGQTKQHEDIRLHQVTTASRWPRHVARRLLSSKACPRITPQIADHQHKITTSHERSVSDNCTSYHWILHYSVAVGVRKGPIAAEIPPDTMRLLRSHKLPHIRVIKPELSLTQQPASIDPRRYRPRQLELVMGIVLPSLCLRLPYRSSISYIRLSRFVVALRHTIGPCCGEESVAASMDYVVCVPRYVSAETMTSGNLRYIPAVPCCDQVYFILYEP